MWKVLDEMRTCTSSFKNLYQFSNGVALLQVIDFWIFRVKFAATEVRENITVSSAAMVSL